MTPEDALERFRACLENHDRCDCCKFEDDCGIDKMELAAIQALCKQIPRKLSIGNDNGRKRKCCNVCGCFVLPDSKYCSKCGQKLKWE